MTLEEIRRAILIAVFSDDKLMDLLVLKGGNALELVLGIGNRGSVDLDFSMPSTFADIEEARSRLFRVIRREFASRDHVAFDLAFDETPRTPRQGQPEWWGGYQLTFKLVRQETWNRFEGDLEHVRRRSEAADLAQRRTFKVDISKYEFCTGKVRRDVDDYTVYVYSPEMIAIEKIRAICQQMPEYELIPPRLKRARARDFYDVCEIVRARDVDFAHSNSIDLFRSIFAAKRVPLALIHKIKDQREFHRPDWPAVEQSVRGAVPSFDEYFDELVELLRPLETLRKE